MINTNEKIRVIAYIDGYNLYHAVRKLKHPKLKWLDLEVLMTNCINDIFQAKNAELTQVKYFTAKAITFPGSSDSSAPKRQDQYFKAIETLSKIEVILGKIKKKDRHCAKCDNYFKTLEEKETDVNIASHLLTDAFDKNFDSALLVSCDSDLVLPVTLLTEKFKRKIIILSPPGRKGYDLAKASKNLPRELKQSDLENCVLPLEITTKDGEIISIPDEWDNNC